MSMRYVMAGALLALGFSGFSSGCSSAHTVCDLVCDCEHCGDPKEDVTCLLYDYQEAMSEAYECSDAWETYMTCVQEKGSCNEKDANFTTRANGTCTVTEPSGGNCMSNADCQQPGNPGKRECSNGNCVVYTCSGNGGDTCDTDADCVGAGDELCGDQLKAVSDCIQKASGGVPPQGF